MLQGPQQISVPTPPATLSPAEQTAVSEAVFDPVTNVTMKVDPEISTLLNNVSTQNMLAYVQTLEGFYTRNTYSVSDVEGRGVGAARRWIFNEFIRVGNGRLLVEVDEFPLNSGGVLSNQQNIVATLPGTGDYPGVIILAAHYDSRSYDPLDGSGYAPGANDNASGVALMLELARLLSAREWEQTIVFAAFAAEEQGRHGSQHFVTQKMLDGWQIDAVLNNDIVGGRPGIPQSIRMLSPSQTGSSTLELIRYIDMISRMYLPDFPVTYINAEDREGRWGDHMSFLRTGIPAVRFTESEEDRDHQHNSSDTSDRIDYNYLQKVAQMNLSVLATIAGAPDRPDAPTVAPMADAGSYILSWLPDESAAAYAISFRPVQAEAATELRYIPAEDATNVAITGLDAQTTYAVSIAALTQSGRISMFSREVVIER